MQENPGQRKLIQAAIAALGVDTMLGRRLESTFKHEGNRHLFAELRRAEEDFLLHAGLRTDRYGNVLAGGPETIAESAMRQDEATMRAAVSEIIGAPDEAALLVDAFIAHARETFRIPDTPSGRPHPFNGHPRRPSPARGPSQAPGRPPGPGIRERLSSLFKRMRGDDDLDPEPFPPDDPSDSGAGSGRSRSG